MEFSGKSLSALFGSVSCLILLVILTALMPAPLAAQSCNLELEVRDTIAFSGEANAVITVYMKNYVDTVGAFELWFILNRPDIMQFVLDSTLRIDTLYWRCLEWDDIFCVDSSDITDSVILYGVEYDWLTADSMYVREGAFDTTGTLISGWDAVIARSLAPGGMDLKVTGMANDFLPPFNDGILPQDGMYPLIKLLTNVYELPDTLQDRTVGILIQKSNLSVFSISDMHGSSIGIIVDTVYEEKCYTCGPGIDPPCDPMWRVPCESPEVDSVWCCDTVYVPYLDTTYVCIEDGWLTAVPVFLCGDVDGNGTVNILDITRLVAYLYKQGEAPEDLRAADVNNSCSTNILDVTALVSYLYKQGAALNCPYFYPCL
ncbi:MAG: dockerin type I repeat-containing protein [Candidatus Zixiibacteriota bacterium]